MKTKKQFTTKLWTALFGAAMLLSSSELMAQVKIGSNPTTIGATNNLEVEASTAGRKTSVDKVTGQVTIKDGTEGASRILTSDANGGASWKDVATLRIPETVWIGEQTGVYTVTPFSGTFDELKDRIPLVARSGSLAGYDPTNKTYTLQSNGYYRINIGALIQGTTPGPLVNFVRLYMGTTGVLQQYDRFSLGTDPVLSTYWEGFFNAGTTFDVYVISETNGGITQNANVSKAFMSITKLF
jgi:hypothetical protein